MELNGAIQLLGVLAIAAILAVVIYCISVSSMTEKTYDEIKAENKKKAEEYFAQGKSAKDKAKDKKLKKAGKKVKEKKSSESVEQSSEDSENSKNHVAFVEPPVVVDGETVGTEENKKQSFKKKEKSILVNKGEITTVSEVPPIMNHFVETVPKDDFALKRSISREEIHVKAAEPQKQISNKPHKGQPSNPPKETKVEKQQVPKQVHPPQKPVEKTVNNMVKSEKPVNNVAKSDKPINNVAKSETPVNNVAKSSEKLVQKPQEKTHEKPKPVEEVIPKSVAKQNQTIAPVSVVENPSPSTKNSRKKRNELVTALQQIGGDKEAVNVNFLVSLVHKADLSWTDVQELINLLLNKQQGLSGDSAEWIEGRQDPVVKLKKQLAEKEKALVEEQQAALALQNKLRELRSELNTERHSAKQLEEGLTSRQTELDTLASRLKLSSEEKQNLVQQIQQLQAQLNEEHMLLCKVQEDQGQTQTVMQQELLAQRQQLEMHIARLTEQHQETMSTMEGQLSQLSIQLQQQEELSERTLLHETQDLTHQLKELHTETDRLRSKSQFDTNHLQNEISTLSDQLIHKRSEAEKLSTLVQTLQTENNRLTHQVSSVCVEAQQLRGENESLAAQVTASMERPATEGRENGDATYLETDTNTDKLHEKEILVEQLKDDIVSKDKEINCFKTDLSHQESVITKLKGELDAAYSNSEVMLKEISSYKSLIQEHEGVIKALQEEGESAHKLLNTLKEDISKNKVEMVRLSQDCATREQLENRESTIEKLTSELNTHKTLLADQTALISSLRDELEKCKKEVANKQSLDSVQLERLRVSIAEKDTELSSLKVQAEILQNGAGQLVAQRDRLQEQLNTQLLKNDGLRTKNWKAIEALAAAENNLETKVKQIQRLISEAEDKVKRQEQERTKQLLQRIVPHITVDNNKDYETWLEHFVSRACNENDDVAMLAEVEQQNCQLQAMVTHYKTIIGDTEGMLNQLQSHAEKEEQKWGKHIKSLESQLDAVKQERDRLEGNSDLAGQLEVALAENRKLTKELYRLQVLIVDGAESLLQPQEQAEVTKGQTKLDDGSGTN